jgi:hypothetical protein
MVSCNIYALSLYFVQVWQNRLLHSKFLRVIILPQDSQHLFLSQTDFFSAQLFILVIIERRLPPEKSLAFITGDSNSCRYTSSARHSVTACLITCVCHPSLASLIASFTNVLLCHRTGQAINHTIVSRDVIIKEICSLG